MVRKNPERKLDKKLDNKGSTMLMVIISVAFVGILCAIVMSVTMTNIKMKTVDRQSKSNFYSVEQALNEIVIGLEELTATRARDAYQYTLERYVDKSDPNILLEMFQMKTAELIKTDLLGSVVGSESSHLASWLAGKLTVSSKANVYMKDDSGKNISLDCDTTGQYVAIRNLKVSYKEQGYETSIQTDIVIDMPDTKMLTLSGAKNVGLPFNEYSLIGNDSVYIANTGMDFKGIGSIYGGLNGITFENIKNGSFLAKNIASLGNISFSSGSEINISNNTSKAASIWADNIETVKKAGNIGVDVKLESNIYVKDDLSVNAPKSNVVISNSSILTGANRNCKYVGFSYPTTASEANNNSAIIVNGIGSKLDLSGLNEVSVGGKSFVMKDGIGNNEIATGESITTKGNQIAYLVPDECITIDGDKGQNPAILQAVGGLIGGNVTIDTNKKVNGVDLSLYLKNPGANTSYTKRVYPITGSSNSYMVYYYLTGFKTDPIYNIESYSRAFASANSEKLESVFPIDGIKVGPGSSISTAGNYTVYDSSKSKGNKEEIKESGPVTVADYIKADREYRAMTKFLEVPEGVGSSEAEKAAWLENHISSNSNDVFENIIKLSDINALPSAEVKTRTENVGGTSVSIDKCVAFNLNPYPAIIIHDTSFTVPPQIKEGLIVCTGDVKLEHNFNGLIIAKGKINVEGSACSLVKADAIKISEIFLAANENINKYFVDTRINSLTVGTGGVASGTSSSIAISDLISFQNWRKN